MNVQFTNASNGEATCSVNGIHLHSSYNPSKEACRFVDSVKCNFSPVYILVTGPALSYCNKYLKELFPNSILCAVHYCDDFSSVDKIWNKVFIYNDSNINLSEELYSFMGDEGLVSCFFLSWSPSEKAFSNLYEKCWEEIKKAILKSRNVLATRSFFAKRWMKNSIRNFLFVKNIYTVKKTTSDIILCASGPSLYNSIPFIKKNQNHLPIICVSSALCPLVENGIYPDLCISTDGGFWAKKHLSFELNKSKETVLAISNESSCFANSISNNKILLLQYGDSTGEMFFNSCDLPFTKALRNGTVSGTAAELALSLTDSNVFFCGLDLSVNKGFCHTQPNELELTDSQFDFRLSTKQTRLTPSSFNSESLEIYKSWFFSTDFNGKLFRLSDNYNYKNTLGKIKDISWAEFDKLVNVDKTKNKILSTKHNFDLSIKQRKEIVTNNILQNSSNESWIQSAAPAEYIIYKRSKNTSGEAKALENLLKAMGDFVNDIKRSYLEGNNL